MRLDHLLSKENDGSHNPVSKGLVLMLFNFQGPIKDLEKGRDREALISSNVMGV